MNNQVVMSKWWYAWWTLATIFCWNIGIFTLWLLNLWLWSSNGFAIILYITVPFVFVAIGQGVLLRHRINKPFLWALITSIGYMAGNYLFLFLVFIFNFVSGDIGVHDSLFGLVIGLIPAIGQFFILKILPKAGWWIPTVIISFTLFAAILLIGWGDSNFYSFDDRTIGNTIFFIILLPGLVLGIPSGVVLQYLLNRSSIQPQNTAG